VTGATGRGPTDVARARGVEHAGRRLQVPALACLILAFYRELLHA